MHFVHPIIQFKDIFKAKLSFYQKKKVNLSAMFPGKHVYFTDMGRSAFKLIIEEMELSNSKMLVPAYICDIFSDIFKQYNIQPIYLDIDKDFIISAEQIQASNAKSILIVHTYGKLGIQAVQEARKHNLLVIEDCAHSWGNKTIGDASFFSLYKLFPCLRGGLAILPKKISYTLPKTRFSIRDYFSFINSFSVFAFLFKKYAGKPAQKNIRKEKINKPAGINRVSLNLFSKYYRKFDLEKRRKLGIFYQQELKKLGFEVQNPENHSFTFMSALIDNRDKLVMDLRKKGVFATRIWHFPINKELPYTKEVSNKIINFPFQLYYTEKHIRKIIACVKECLSSGA